MIKELFIKLIDKYFAGTASENEQRLVKEYLTRLEANDNATLDVGREQKLKEAMWKQIQLQTIQKSVQVVRMPWYRSKAFRFIAVAASIILVFGLGIVLFTNKKHSGLSVAVQNDERTDSSTSSFVRHEINTTGIEKRIQLSDGSLIVLANKSEVTFRQPFIENRDVTLIGKAYFKVAKDKTRPFTVISGDISTTALGTEFTVTALRNTKKIVVRLYEGKVVVKSVDKRNKRMKNDVYLLPGQSFVYSGETAAKVKAFKLNNTDAPEKRMNEEIERDNPSIPQNTQGSWYMFNNQSLGEVFEQLEQMFGVTIKYDKNDVQNIYFTRKYNRTDSLESILKEISVLHNLTITKRDSAFIISK